MQAGNDHRKDARSGAHIDNDFVTLHPQTSRTAATAERVFGRIRQLFQGGPELVEDQEWLLDVLGEEVECACGGDELLEDEVLDLVEAWLEPAVQAHTLAGAGGVAAAEEVFSDAVAIWDSQERGEVGERDACEAVGRLVAKVGGRDHQREDVVIFLLVRWWEEGRRGPNAEETQDKHNPTPVLAPVKPAAAGGVPDGEASQKNKSKGPTLGAAVSPRTQQLAGGRGGSLKEAEADAALYQEDGSKHQKLTDSPQPNGGKNEIVTKHKKLDNSPQPNGGKDEIVTKHKKLHNSPQPNGGMDEIVTKHKNPDNSPQPNGGAAEIVTKHKNPDNSPQPKGGADEIVTKHKKQTQADQQTGSEDDYKDKHKKHTPACRNVAQRGDEVCAKRTRRRRRMTRIVGMTAVVYGAMHMTESGETRSTFC
mgnify:CR=1 FL=1